MSQRRTIRERRTALQRNQKDLQSYDDKLMAGVRDGVVTGDSVLAKINVPSLATDVFVPAVVRELDPKNERVQVELSGKQSLAAFLCALSVCLFVCCPLAPCEMHHVSQTA